MGSYPPPGYAYPVQPQMQPQRQMQPQQRPVQQPAPPKFTARGVAPETPPPPMKPAPIDMPSPTALGVATPSKSPDNSDWTGIRQRLQAVGATTFQATQLRGNQWVFTLAMPTTVPGKVHRVEAEAATEAEAITRALTEAERWRKAQ